MDTLFNSNEIQLYQFNREFKEKKPVLFLITFITLVRYNIKPETIPQ